MAKKTKDQASVVTFADYEVITPPNPLRGVLSNVETTDDPVARAEAALAKLSSEFSGWMEQECNRLDQARAAVRGQGFNTTTQDALFRAAHDIKGHAATFGFPAVAAAANSLCRLVEHVPDVERIPLSLIDQHVDAVRAIIREYARPDVEAVAESLTRKLRDVTDDFLRQENLHRPDYLDGIVAPPTAPET